ncbi:MAG: DUF4097 family beta strand repeat protein [Corynebacteriales bacterium]|nr:DUF4097 family beta strand repeat protein [Mycobacteriales bacterium]
MNGSRTAWISLGGIFAVLAIVAGIGGLWTGLWFNAPNEDQTQRQNYERAIERLEIDSTGGNITIIAGPENRASVEQHIRWAGDSRPSAQAIWEGTTLRIVGKHCIGPRECGIDYTITVPAGVQIFAHSKGGDINVTEMASSHADIETGNGDVRISYSDPPEQVRAVTADGDVNVVVPLGDSYTVQSQGQRGDNRVSVTEDANSGRSIVARTGGGDVEVRYP